VGRLNGEFTGDFPNFGQNGRSDFIRHDKTPQAATHEVVVIADGLGLGSRSSLDFLDLQNAGKEEHKFGGSSRLTQVARHTVMEPNNAKGFMGGLSGPPVRPSLACGSLGLSLESS
jgi:hypothetical protein